MAKNPIKMSTTKIHDYEDFGIEVGNKLHGQVDPKRENMQTKKKTIIERNRPAINRNQLSKLLIRQVENLFGQGLLRKASEIERPTKKIEVDIDGLELWRMVEN